MGSFGAVQRFNQRKNDLQAVHRSKRPHVHSVTRSGEKHPRLCRVKGAMKIALKYGIAVTLTIAAWVAAKHFVLHFEGSRAQIADIVVFNLSAIVELTMGIRAKRNTNGGWLTFVQGLKTGISIAV